MEQQFKEQRFKYFTSFEEARNYEDEYAAQQDPLERMAATLKTIKAIYNYKPREQDLTRTFELRRLY